MSNEHSVNGIKPSSKSRWKREPAARAHHHHRWRAEVAAHRRNALKHGAFAIDPTIPGEDFQEFTELYAALIVEWQPSGITEADAVFSLADHVAQAPSAKNAPCQVDYEQLPSW